MLETQEQMQVYEADTLAIPSIRVVLGEVPNPDPSRRRKAADPGRPANRDVLSAVRRLIAHLENSR